MMIYSFVYLFFNFLIVYSILLDENISHEIFLCHVEI